MVAEQLDRAEFSASVLTANLETELTRQKQLLEATIVSHQMELQGLIKQATEKLQNPASKASNFTVFSDDQKAQSWFQFQEDLLKYLPEIQQYALLDAQGEIVLDNNGFFMGIACRKMVEEGLLQPADSGYQAIQAHFFHDGEHHYDLIYFFYNDEKPAGALIVSIPMTYLVPYLSQFTDANLEVLLLNANHPNQVILSTFEELDRQVGASVSPAFLQQSLYVKEIPQTQWGLYYFPALPMQWINPHYVWILLASVAFGLIFLLLLNKNFTGRYIANLRQQPENLYASGSTALVVLEAQSPYKILYFSENRFAGASILTQSVALNQPFDALLHSADKDKWQALVFSALQNSDEVPSALLRLQKVDSMMDVLLSRVTVVPQRDANGQLLKFVLYLDAATDVYELRNAYRELVQSLPFPVVVTDEKSRLSTANEQALQLFGVRLEKVQHTPLTSRMTSANAQAYREHMDAVLQASFRGLNPSSNGLQGLQALQSLSKFEFRVAFGKVQSYYVSLQLIPNVNGNGFIHFLIPVMETAKVENCEDMTKRFYESSLARFNVGHHIADELSELMNFLRGVSDRLKFTFVDKVSKLHADEIRARSDAVMRSLQDFKFLAMKDIDSGKSSFDAYILIEESIYLLRLKARWHGVSFHFSYASTCPYVWIGYENQIKQIVLHVFAYMIDRMNCEDVLVDADSIKSDNQGVRLQIVISAKGSVQKCRTAAEHLREDFAVLEQLTPTGPVYVKHDRHLQGLDISLKLLQSMGGSLRLSSAQESEQLSIRLEIPVEKEMGSAHDDEGQARADTQQHLQGLRYLVVERDTVVKELLSNLLQRNGAEVDIVNSGIDAIGFWRNYGYLYEGLLIEADSEVMSAKEVVNFIRREEAESMIDRHFPILLMINRGELRSEDREFYDGFIEKPLMIEQVLSALKEHIKHLE